jgi:hypothetical protein
MPLRELMRVLGELRYRGPSPKLCPICGSPRIKQALIGIIPPIYVCDSCGYRGSLALEVQEEEGEGRGGGGGGSYEIGPGGDGGSKPSPSLQAHESSLSRPERRSGEEN